MSKEVQMTFRVKPELRAAFANAALQEDRPASQVLRELMRAYVSKFREHDALPTNDALSLTERRRRENTALKE